jgi:hypothetical protein
MDDAVRRIRGAMDEAAYTRATRRGAAMAPHEADDFALARIREVLAVHGARQQPA